MENQKNGAVWKSRLENLWYHSKWAILIGGFLAAFLLYTFFTGLGQARPDANLLYVGKTVLGVTQRQELTDLLCQQVIRLDANGNGAVEVDLIHLQPRLQGENELGEPVYQSQFYTDFQHELHTGDTSIFLIENLDIYEELLVDDLLVPLNQLFDQLPDAAADAFSLRLGDTSLYQLKAFRVLDPDTRLCLRQPRVVEGKTTQADREKHQSNRQVFCDMVAFTLLTKE